MAAIIKCRDDDDDEDDDDNNNNDDDDDDNNNNNNNVECKNKGDTSNDRGDWDYFKVIQKIREQHQENMKSRNYRKQPYWALHIYFGKY